MPITKPSKINLRNLVIKEQLQGAIEQMNKTHGGKVLNETKERLVDFLAVSLSREDKGLGGTGCALCLVASPGIGKTSLFLSAARGMKRPLYEIPLGSVIAPWELGGTSEGWNNAQPGLIARTADRARADAESVEAEAEGVLRPHRRVHAIMLLDEIDKMARGTHWGCPHTPLLDALDKEKNKNFRDLFDGEDNPRDLSGITWFATANTTDTIPEPLMSRLQIVQIPGYDYEDRFAIAQEHFLPKKLAWAGFDPESLVVESEVLEVLADGCTEDGLRLLESQIERIVSVASNRAVMTGCSSQTITKADLEPMGITVTPRAKRRPRTDYGVVTVMAQTERGDWTPIELQVRTTGQSGDIVVTPELNSKMTAAIRLGLGVVNSRVDQLGLPAEARTASYHFHFEAGSASLQAFSVGASATSGVAVALASLWTKKPTRDAVSVAKLDLTGRLRSDGNDGNVAAAAARHRVPLVYLASEAKSDPSKPLVTGDAHVRYMETFDQLLRHAIPSWGKGDSKGPTSAGYL